MSDKKRGLGRGLDALLGGPAETVQSLGIDQLKPNRLQPRSRFDEAGLQELADSIRAHGIIQSIVVNAENKGTYTIIAGERRWRAARLAGLARVPVVVRQVGQERELLEMALVENLQRTDLNAVEEAEAYKTLQDTFGLTQEAVAARVGKGRPTVANALRLLRLPGQVLDWLRSGELSAGQARPLLSLGREEAQVRLARRAVEQGLSARQLEALVASPPEKKKRPKKAPEAHAEAAAEKLTLRLQTKVQVLRRGRGGTIRIHFHSEEELMRLYEWLTQRGGKA